MRVIRIGRNANCDFIINHPSVSGSHADLYVYENGALQLVEHSTNGTYVNQNYVHNTMSIVQPYDVLTFPDGKPVPVSALLEIGNHPQEEQPIPVNKPKGMIKPGLSFGETLTHFFQNYTNFSGRARRQEFWYMYLWNLIFTIVPFVNILWVLFTIVPNLALTVRRLHDVGKSGLLLFLSFIPIFGSFILLFLYMSDSEKEENQWGPSPKYE